MHRAPCTVHRAGTFDEDRNGTLERAELKRGLSSMGAGVAEHTACGLETLAVARRTFGRDN